MTTLNTNNTFKFLTKVGDNYACWCTTEGVFNTTFRDFYQYVLDNCNDPNAFIIYEVETENTWKFRGIAERWLKMRKRDFCERIENVKTGIWAKCE